LGVRNRAAAVAGEMVTWIGGAERTRRGALTWLIITR
jgi:hypothetical protein